MVDERGRAREQRLHPADERGRAHALLVERAVEPPPDALEDLDEALGRLERVGHAAGERRVEMRVRADVAGDDEAPGAVAARASGLGDDPPVPDVDVEPVDLDGIEGRDDGGAGEDHVRSFARRRCGTAASAAGESFIGQSRPADAVERVQRARDCGSSGHERCFADALGAERAFGLRLLDEDALDLRAFRSAG